MNKNFNLSTWAIGNRSLILYFMLVISLAGAWCYTGLGRGEDPSFTIKTMVVETLWPGATTQEIWGRLPSSTSLRSWPKKPG